MIIFLFLLSILFVGSVLADPGDIDTTGFGAPNGYVTESLGTAGTNANAVAIQSD